MGKWDDRCGFLFGYIHALRSSPPHVDVNCKPLKCSLWFMCQWLPGTLYWGHLWSPVSALPWSMSNTLHGQVRLNGSPHPYLGQLWMMTVTARDIHSLGVQAPVLDFVEPLTFNTVPNWEYGQKTVTGEWILETAVFYHSIYHTLMLYSIYLLTIFSYSLSYLANFTKASISSFLAFFIDIILMLRKVLGL